MKKRKREVSLDDIEKIKIRKGDFVVTEELQQMADWVEPEDKGKEVEGRNRPDGGRDLLVDELDLLKVSRQTKLKSKRVHFPVIEKNSLHTSSSDHPQKKAAAQHKEDVSPTVQGQRSRAEARASVAGAGRDSRDRLIASILVPKQKSANRAGVDLSKDPYVKLGARKVINRVNKRSKLIPPNSEEAPRFIIEVTINGEKHKKMLDSGADCSVTGMENIKEENKGVKHKLFKWKGGPVGTIHDAFRVLGAWKEVTTLQDTIIGAHFCVVAEKLEMPILGLD